MLASVEPTILGLGNYFPEVISSWPAYESKTGGHSVYAPRPENIQVRRKYAFRGWQTEFPEWQSESCRVRGPERVFSFGLELKQQENWKNQGSSETEPTAESNDQSQPTNYVNPDGPVKNFLRSS